MKRSTVSSVILAAWSIFGSAAPSTAAQAGKTTCLDTAQGKVSVGWPCIRGTYLDQVNVITQTGPDRSERVASILSEAVSLWAVGMGRLQGTARLTYGITEVLADAKAARCGTRSAVVKP